MATASARAWSFAGTRAWWSFNHSPARARAGRAKLRVPMAALPRMVQTLTALQTAGVRPPRRRGHKSALPARALSDRDLTTTLVALRFWQQRLVANAGKFGVPVWDHFDEVLTPLSIEEIDDLCERLNCQLKNE